MNRKLLSLPRWWASFVLFFFLCVEKLQMLCSNSTQTTLHLAVGVKNPPDCKCSWQLKQEAELQCLLHFLNSALAAGQQTAPVCENCVFPGCGAVWRKKKSKTKCVKFWENVEILCVSVTFCVWCILDSPFSKTRLLVIQKNPVSNDSMLLSGETFCSIVSTSSGMETELCSAK